MAARGQFVGDRRDPKGCVRNVAILSGPAVGGRKHGVEFLLIVLNWNMFIGVGAIEHGVPPNRKKTRPKFVTLPYTSKKSTNQERVRYVRSKTKVKLRSNKMAPRRDQFKIGG